MPRLSGRIALITGASRGIGAAVARRFVQEGAHVLLLARSSEGLEKIDDDIRTLGGHATLIPMDLADDAAIDSLAPSIAQRFGKLDVLVGNAAQLGTLSPITHESPEQWAQVMQVNLHANWRLLRALEPLLMQSDAPRAMFVTSGVAGRTAAYWGSYAVSKSALEAMVRTYAAETKEHTIRVNLLDPGRVRTAMRASAFPGEDPETLPAPDDITDVFVELASAECTMHGQVIHAQK